ncbi:MAG: hypothetical protein AAGK71_00660 [Pseudomonadota bacterium]
MRVWALIGALLALSACGIDGPPSPPGGPSVSGDARIGVVGTL